MTLWQIDWTVIVSGVFHWLMIVGWLENEWLFHLWVGFSADLSWEHFMPLFVSLFLFKSRLSTPDFPFFHFLPSVFRPSAQISVVLLPSPERWNGRPAVKVPLHLANRSNHLICNCLLFNYLLLLTGMIGSYIRTELFFLLLQFLPGIPFLSMLSKGRRKKLPRVPKSAHFAQKCPEVFFCFGAQPESIYSGT